MLGFWTQAQDSWEPGAWSLELGAFYIELMTVIREPLTVRERLFAQQELKG